jgi:hypothetical protein
MKAAHSVLVSGWPDVAHTARCAVRRLVSQSRTVPSLLAAARVWPARLNATEYTCPAGPVSVAINVGRAGLRMFQSQMVPSVAPAASMAELELNATE